MKPLLSFLLILLVLLACKRREVDKVDTHRELDEVHHAEMSGTIKHSNSIIGRTVLPPLPRANPVTEAPTPLSAPTPIQILENNNSNENENDNDINLLYQHWNHSVWNPYQKDDCTLTPAETTDLTAKVPPPAGFPSSKAEFLLILLNWLNDPDGKVWVFNSSEQILPWLENSFINQTAGGRLIGELSTKETVTQLYDNLVNSPIEKPSSSSYPFPSHNQCPEKMPEDKTIDWDKYPYLDAAAKFLRFSTYVDEIKGYEEQGVQLHQLKGCLSKEQEIEIFVVYPMENEVLEVNLNEALGNKTYHLVHPKEGVLDVANGNNNFHIDGHGRILAEVNSLEDSVYPTFNCLSLPLSEEEDTYINRAEISVIIVEMSLEEDELLPEATGMIFTDVQKDLAEAPYIEQFFKDGYLKGCAKGKFCPKAEITRAEFAAIIDRFKYASDLEFAPDEELIINDVTEESEFSQEIFKAVQAGFMELDEEDNFRPSAPITQAEVMKILNQSQDP